MPHNAQDTGTLYYTAPTSPLDNNNSPSGTGSVIEVLANSAEQVIRISGFAKAIAELQLPAELIDNGLFFEKTITPKKMKKMGKKASPRSDVTSIIHRGNEYVTVCVPIADMNRHQLHDRLHGLGWQMKAYNVSEVDTGSNHSEMWFKNLAD